MDPPTNNRNLTVDGLAGTTPVTIDCSDVIGAVTQSLNNSNFEKLERLILAQQQQINGLLPVNIITEATTRRTRRK